MGANLCGEIKQLQITLCKKDVKECDKEVKTMYTKCEADEAERKRLAALPPVVEKNAFSLKTAGVCLIMAI
jgi:hypothetical protein